MTLCGTAGHGPCDRQFLTSDFASLTWAQYWRVLFSNMSSFDPSAPPRRQTRARGTVKLIQREAEWDPNIAMELNLDTELKEAYESAYAANDLGYFKNHTMNEFIHLVKLMYCTLKNSPVARQKFKETLSRISKKGHKNVMNGVYTWHQSFIAYDLPAAIGVKVKNTLI